MRSLNGLRMSWALMGRGVSPDGKLNRQKKEGEQ